MSVRERRKKNKKGKTEDELQQIQNDINKEEKKEKRGSRNSEEPSFPEDEGDSNRKARKRKRARTLEDAGGLETSELEQRSKVSRTSEEKSESEDELMMRQKVKSKKAKLGETLIADGEVDVEEVHSKKKTKKSRLKEEEGVAIEEVEEVSVSKKKKSRREKASELPFPSELIVEEKRKKKSSEFSTLQEHKTSRKKGSKNLVVEELHKTQTQPHAEVRKSKSREEKCSQEKVVSTSTIINLESEDVSEESYSSSQSIASYQGQQHIQDKTVGCNSKHFVVDSLTDPLVTDGSLFPERRRKRKRKHKKKYHKELDEKEGGNISGVTGITVEKHGKPSTSTDLTQSLNYQWPSNNQRPLLNSSFTRKHVRFTSDDEGLARKNGKKNSQDIEIVETTTTTGEDGFQVSAGISPSYQWGNKSNQSPDSWPPFTAKATRGRNVPRITSSPRNVPVDLEAEEYEGNDIFLSRHKSPRALSKTPTSSSSNLDELATLRRICENKTITVCKVDSRKEQTRPRAKETSTSSPVPPPYLSPPSPLLLSPKRTSEETRQAFHNIMAMQNNPSPIFSSNPRQVVHVEDSDTSYARYRGAENYVQDINVKSTSKLHPSDSRKANGEGLPVSLSAHNVLPRSPTTQQQMYGHQAGQRGEMSQTSQQVRNEGWKETRTTKLLSSIINETITKRGNMTPQPRSRESPKRMQQSLGAVLSNLRDQDGGNIEVDEGELEILGNRSSTCSTPGRDSILNRQLLAKPLEPLPNVQSPGTSTKKLESPARAASQKMSTGALLMVESEVVDLESEEEIEIPVAKSMELGTPSNTRNLSGRTPPSELEKFTKKPINDSIPGLDSPKVAPLRTDKVDNRKSTSSHVAEIIEGRLSSSCVPEGDQQDDLIVEDDLECKDISPESELIDDDGDEELEVEEEEQEEIGVDEEEEEIGLEEEEEAKLDAEVIDDDDMSNIYDDLEEKKGDRTSIDDIAATQEKIELEYELSSRLKESLEKFSESFTKTKSGSENVVDVNTKDDSEIIIGMNTNRDCESGTSNINSKKECERTMDTKTSLNSKKVINVAGKSQGDTREMGSVAVIQDASGKKPITSQESGTSNMEIEELVTKDMEEKTLEAGCESPMEHDQYEESKPSEEWFRQHKLIKNPPKEGQYIAVKLLSLDESMCPVYSNYLQARVMRVQGSQIHLKFVDKIMPKKKTGKEFEEVDLTHEEVDLTEDLEDGETVEEMDWRDIHEPRLLLP